MQYLTLTFEQLSSLQLWKILRLRQEVFVLEQQCLFPEIDDRDPAAIHLLAYPEMESDAQPLAAYCRLLAPGQRFPEPAISRVVVAPSHRRGGVGLQLMQQAISETRRIWKPSAIRISAQQHLEPFYSRVGFQTCSATYLEDDIAHVDMKLER